MTRSSIPGWILESTRTARRAFTLVELLVVLLIISLLVYVLLPAVQTARVSAGKQRCQDRMKGIGIALHNYHTAFRSLPAGLDMSGASETPILWSWRVQLLPFLDQEPLANQLDWSRGVQSPRNRESLATPLPAMICPIDPLGETLHAVDAGDMAGDWALSSYLGVSGPWGLVTDEPSAILSAEQCASLERRFRIGLRAGSLYENSWAPLASSPDGTSNVLLIGERGIPDRGAAGWLSGPGIAGACPVGWTDTVLPMADNLDLSHFAEPTNTDSKLFHWWSHHPGGANFGFADTRAVFLNYNVDPEVLSQWSRRDSQSEFD